MAKSVRNKPVSSADNLIDVKIQQIRMTRPEDFENIRQEYLTHYKPLGDEERIILEWVARMDWLTRALRMVDTMIWGDEMTMLDDSPFRMAQAWINKSDVLMRVQRRSELAQKAWEDGLREWERLKALRAKFAAYAEPAPAPEPAAEEPEVPGDPGPWVQ